MNGGHLSGIPTVRARAHWSVATPGGSGRRHSNVSGAEPAHPSTRAGLVGVPEDVSQTVVIEIPIDRNRVTIEARFRRYLIARR